MINEIICLNATAFGKATGIAMSNVWTQVFISGLVNGIGISMLVGIILDWLKKRGDRK